MSTLARPTAAGDVIYPDTDGLPMGEDTLKFEWIMLIKFGLEVVYLHDPKVFIAGDLFWYSVEGDPRWRMAPDVMVVFGRPKGHRSSYLQWLEEGIPPQVTFEIRTPSNRGIDLDAKFNFYEKYGVEEYYIYDPESCELSGWLRQGSRLLPIGDMDGWKSPRLDVRFDMSQGELKLLGPDGAPFASYIERFELQKAAEAALAKSQQRAERLAAKLRDAGIDPDA